MKHEQQGIENTYSLLLSGHISPAPLALLLDGTLWRFGTKVVSNDSASALHVEEVRGQGTLGGIRIMGALLALLLLLDGVATEIHDRVAENLSGSALEVGEEVGRTTIGNRLTKEQVSLTDVLSSEAAQKLKNGAETTNSL